MYAVISLPLESRTRATLRSAELGFLGVIVFTWRQTPRLNGDASNTGDLVLYFTGRRGLRASWLIVGIKPSFPSPRRGTTGPNSKRSDREPSRRLEPAFPARGVVSLSMLTSLPGRTYRDTRPQLPRTNYDRSC